VAGRAARIKLAHGLGRRVGLAAALSGSLTTVTRKTEQPGCAKKKGAVSIHQSAVRRQDSAGLS